MSPTCTPEKKKDYVQLHNSNELYFVTNEFNDDLQSETEIDVDEEKKQIENLASLFPQLSKFFFFHKKVGSGTFSTVYLASLKGDDTFKKRYAVKHIVPTCHPNRIETELKCLKEIGGIDNVAGIELCLRNRNNVILIMPYQPHDPFKDYVGKVDAAELACYMSNLLKALTRVHKFNFVHRDIKPSNFLYDRKNKRFLLVDFGLAHSVIEKHDEAETTKKRKRNVSSASDSDAEHVATKKRAQTNSYQLRKQGLSQKENNPRESSTRDLKLVKPISLTTIISPPLKKTTIGRVHLPKDVSAQLCKCYGKARTCSSCVIKKNMRALRAGTPGFRPPEVLLKLTNQNTAVDIWAVGIIMLSMLSGCLNFFSSPDDLTALAEIVLVFGLEEVKKMAGQYGRYLICSENCKPLDLKKICCTLRSRERLLHLINNVHNKCGDCKQPECLCVCLGKPLHPNIQDEFPDLAYDLLKRLLDINPRTRISAEDALQHPFLKE